MTTPSLSSHLGHELYELMLSDEGATVAAIAERPGLMDLRYVREESKKRLALGTDGVAESVRQYLEQATYALDQPVSQREHTDADNGYAARILLGLEVGTDVLLLSKRRQKAAPIVGLTISGMAKRRRDGRTSWEQRLMNSLARRMAERETAFLYRHSVEQQKAIVQPYSLVPSYEILFLAIVAVGTLQTRIGTLHLYTHEPAKPQEYPRRAALDNTVLREEYDSAVTEVLANYGLVLTITTAGMGRLRKIADTFVDGRKVTDPYEKRSGFQISELESLPPLDLVGILHVLSPWTEYERLELTATVRRVISGAPLDRHDLNTTLDAKKYEPLRNVVEAWIADCPCKKWRGVPVDGCRVHTVVCALELWEAHIQAAWMQIGKSLASIDEYAIYPPAQVLADLGIENG